MDQQMTDSATNVLPPAGEEKKKTPPTWVVVMRNLEGGVEVLEFDSKLKTRQYLRDKDPTKVVRLYRAQIMELTAETKVVVSF